MEKRNTIVPVTLGFNTVVRIPESWTAFVYRGFLYERDESGRFVCRGTFASAPMTKGAKTA